MKEIELSVIIVHYETPILLKNCIQSLHRSDPNFPFEVIVVDNSQSENAKNNILTEFPETNWIDAKYNAGFSRANNMGIRASKGSHILLLNPDTEVKDAFLKKIHQFYIKQNSHIGLLTCRIKSFNNGELLTGSWKEFPSYRKFLKGNPLYILLNRIRKRSLNSSYIPSEMHYQNHEISVASGACSMVEKDKIVKNDLWMDEDFFLYSEDVEWSYRIKKAGYYNYFCGELEIEHVNSASTGKSESRDKQIIASELLYFYKTDSFFTKIIFILTTNFYLNRFLLNRKNDFQKLSVLESNHIFVKEIIKKIRNTYFPRPSSGEKYLKV